MSYHNTESTGVVQGRRDRRRGRGLPARLRTLAAIAAAALVAGCAVGPDFKRPDAPNVDGYLAGALPLQTAASSGPLGDGQRIVSAPVPAAWWTELHSPKLDAMIELALRASLTLSAAQATLRQAQQHLAAQAGSTQWPQVSAGLGAQRQGINTAAMGQPGGQRTFDLYSASIAVGYNLDLSGGIRRELEALAAQVDYQSFQLEAARLNLVANVALAAISQAQLTAQAEASDQILRAQQEQLDIAVLRRDAGAASDNDVLALQSQTERTRASIPPLTNRIEQTRHLLAQLTGRPPASADDEPFTLADFSLPVELPLTVPSELARRRPDIRASEALLHAASAQVGVAVSRQYPSLTLSASLGSQALTTAGLFGAGSFVWGLAGQLAQPLFNPGLRAGTRAAQAGLDAADANYRQTVLQALRNVADVLRTVENDALAQQSTVAAADAARQSLGLVEQQYALGAASYLQLLTAQQQDQQLRIELAASRAQRLANSVALYQAMGGDWSDPA